MRCSQVTQIFMQNKAVFVLKNARKGSKFHIGCLVCIYYYIQFQIFPLITLKKNYHNFFIC